MNVLITGAAGFLGSHLMLHHLRLGSTVLGIDNYCSSSRNSLHVAEIRSLIASSSGTSTLYYDDITVPLTHCVYEYMSTGRGRPFDVIYNFACPASPNAYQSMPVETTMTCVAGLHNVLQLARAQRAIVVHASTSEVYGDPEVPVQHESYRGCVNPYGPRACYDEGKRAAEALCYDFLHKHGVDVRVVRIFNTYGPHMHPNDGRVISNFVCQTLRDQPIVVYGDGHQTRSFCYCDDLIDGIVRIGSLTDNPGGPINLGNPNEFTIAEVAELMASKHGAKVVNTDDVPVDDPMRRRPDITRARELLGWEPRVQLAEGIERTIEHFKRVRDERGLDEIVGRR